jgi:hypothetical protein
VRRKVESDLGRRVEIATTRQKSREEGMVAAAAAAAVEIEPKPPHNHHHHHHHHNHLPLIPLS